MNEKYLSILFLLVAQATVVSQLKPYPIDRVLVKLTQHPSGAERQPLAASASETIAIKNLAFDDRVLAREISDRYIKKLPLQTLPDDLTLAQAIQVQDKFIELLAPTYGKPIGYKAGLTNKELQAKLKIDRPVSGVLLEKMLLKNGAIVPANFGVRPVLEGDLIVRVSSDKINTAKTPQEILDCLDAVIPFLELPDLMYAENVKLTAPQIVAINVGARLGVMGEPIRLNNKKEWQERLKTIQIVIDNEKGDRLATGNVQTALGDPLDIVLWLRDDLQARGRVLKKGDLLSLGTIAPTIPVQSNTTVRARYIGLERDRPVELSVKFE